MNYRHAFHAGNFADVLKHIVLVRAIVYLKQKPAPFRVIDTHAGIGLYDLTSEEATRTQEWQHGIARLIAAEFTPDVLDLLQPYLDAVAHENRSEPLRYYPGSPKFVDQMLRDRDRLIVNELHPEDHKSLVKMFAKSRRVKVMGLDGWTVLKAVLPPKERRGITIIDPSFEEPGEFDRLVQSVRDHHRRFETGTLILWYPIKDRKRVTKFYQQIADQDVRKALYCEVRVDTLNRDGPVKAAGLIVINPPYPLYSELQLLLPQLCEILKQGEGAGYALKWLIEERGMVRDTLT